MSLRYSVGKVRISAVTMRKAVGLLEEQVETGRAHYVCVANVETTLLAQKDREFCHIQNESLLTTPDGMPLRWYAKLAGVVGVERVTGVDLMLEVMRVSREKGYTHYFYGDTDDTLSQTVEAIKERYPNIAVKGVCSPPFRPFTEEDINSAVAEINHLEPTFVWVALGAPKQEIWMSRIVKEINRSILVGVGAAFRVLTGYYRRPHPFVRAIGLEGGFWRFRHNAVDEALWYCKYVPRFAPYLLTAVLKRLSQNCREAMQSTAEDA